MALFRKGRLGTTSQHTRGLPANIISMMERFGRHEWDPMGSTDTETWSATQEPLWPFASSDPDGFITTLADAVCPIGGWAAYGGARTALNLISPAPLDKPAFRRLMDAALDFLRANGVPPMRLSGYEWDHWIGSGGTIDTWLPLRATPSPEICTIRPLDGGEMRRVTQLTHEQDSNAILIGLDGDGRVTAFIDAKWSDEDPRRVQNPWKSADSLFDLYRDVALAMQTPPYWCDAELEPFFPLAKPSI